MKLSSCLGICNPTIHVSIKNIGSTNLLYLYVNCRFSEGGGGGGGLTVAAMARGRVWEGKLLPL